MTGRPRAQAIAFLCFGVVLLIALTAVLSAAVSSSRTLARIERVQDRQEQQSRVLADQDAARKARSQTLARDNDVLQYQNRVLQQKVLVLIRLLRAQGIAVPKVVATPSPSPVPRSTRPKASNPRPTSPGTPTPTGPTPSGPSPSPNPPPSDPCVLIPVLCVGLSLDLPPVLP